MADVGGVTITVTQETIRPVAQQLACWSRTGPGPAVEYRTGGLRPAFRIPAGACAERDPLVLAPGATAVTCVATGEPNRLTPTAVEVGGRDPGTCVDVPAPTGLAVSGAPTATSITVGWEAPAGAVPDHYEVLYRVKAGPGQWARLIVPAGTLTATAAGLTAGTEYEFAARAWTGGSVSAATAPVTIATAAS